MQNFKIVIEYDGTRFFGWQRQTDKPTIQGELEAVLGIILNQEIKIHGSGRTDAGVHARGQVAHFHAKTGITPAALKKGVNGLMKHPIVVLTCDHVPDDFHARYMASSKEYRYTILNRHDGCAIGRDYVWHVRRPLDVDAMNLCCEHLVGIHDFKAFENTGSPRSSTVREIFFANWTKKDKDHLVLRISASGFLKNMVRILVGTLQEVGRGKMSPDDFHKILLSADRSRASATAPSRGLLLHRVLYK